MANALDSPRCRCTGCQQDGCGLLDVGAAWTPNAVCNAGITKKVKYLREAFSCRRCLCKNGCNWLALQCLCEEYKVNENHPPPSPGVTAFVTMPPPRPPPTATSADGIRQPSPPRPLPRSTAKASEPPPPMPACATAKASEPPPPRPAGANVSAATVISPTATPGLRKRPTSCDNRITWQCPATAVHVQGLIDAVAVLGEQIQALQVSVNRIEVRLDLD